MRNFETIIVNQDVALKQIEMSDAQVIFKTVDNQREYLGKWLPFVKRTKGLEDINIFINSVNDPPKGNVENVFIIKYQGKFAGLIGFKGTDKINKRTEIGYWLSKFFQKKGIITQSLQALCKFAFKEMDMNRIQIKVATGNIPSKKIPQRLNFKFEGTEREGEKMADGNFVDLEVYSILRSEFEDL